MRKFLLAAVLAAVSVSGVYAQKLDDVQEKFSKGKYDEAKEKIDKFLADPKNQSNASAWYWKGNVYAQLAKMDSTHTLPYDATHEAFLAYKKYQEMDAKNVLMTLEQNVGLFVLRDIYASKGDHFWNEKDFSKAHEAYKAALGVEEYITKKGFSYNGFSYPALDTTLVRYTAAAAYSAKREDDAIPYFEKLADARIPEKDFRDIYALLVQYYQGKNNQQKADKYLAMGKQLFPDEDFWIGMELGELGNDRELRMKRLGELTVKYPTNAALSLDYAIEVRNHAYIWETKPADYKVRQDQLEKAMAKAIELNPTLDLAHFLLAEHYYIQISDIEEELRVIRGNTAADQAKKKEINGRLDKKYDDLHGASLKAYDLYSKHENMKVQDKANYRKVMNQLIDYYSRKKNTERVTYYQNKIKSL